VTALVSIVALAACAVLLARLSGPASRLLPPRMAAWSLTVCSVLVAAATAFVLGTAAFETAAQLPVVASLGRWSPRSLQGAGGSVAVGLLSLAVLTVALLAGVYRAGASVRDLARTERTCRQVGGSPGEVVVITDARPDAYALAGISTGRIVVSTAMLDQLDGLELRSVIAHEASHLRHRHHVFLSVGACVGAANPLLRPVSTTVRAVVERWADEDAARAVGDRRVVARAIARAGLAVGAFQHGSVLRRGLAATAGDVPGRATALLQPPPRPNRLLAAALALIAVAAVASGATQGESTEHQFEQARDAYVAQSVPASQAAQSVLVT